MHLTDISTSCALNQSMFHSLSMLLLIWKKIVIKIVEIFNAY